MINLEKLDMEDYNTYFFPHNPLESRRKDLIFKQFVADKGDCDDEHDKFAHEVNVVSKMLEDALLKDENRYRKPLDFDYDGDTVNITNILFPQEYTGPLFRINTNDQVTANDLSGKYVMVCCFFVPMLWNSNSSTWDVVLASYDLYANMPGKIEVVIVVKMRGPWNNDETAFNDFLSGFHPSCLAVPFKDMDRSDSICNYLATMDLPLLFLVDPSGKVLIHSKIPFFCARDLVPSYREPDTPFPFISLPSDAYPHALIYKPPSTLEQCLCSHYVSRMTFPNRKRKRKRNRQPTLSWEKVSISVFQSKYVLLYLYSFGDRLPLLRQLDQACKRRGNLLEIVVVYVPHRLTHNPWSFLETFATLLHDKGLSWWVAPINYTSYSTLPWYFGEEKFVIVAPNDQFVDPRALEVLQIYGIDDYYPFTFKHIVDITTKQLRQVTLKFLLPSSCKGSLYTGKVVLLYFDYPSFIDPLVYDAFYRFSKKSNIHILPFSLESASEVQSHLRDRIGEPEITDYSSKLDWFYSDVVTDFFLGFFNRDFPTIVAFGKDGRLCSVLAHSRLPSSHADKASPIKASLKKEVSFLLDDHYNLDVLEYLIREPYDLDLVIKAKKSVVDLVASGSSSGPYTPRNVARLRLQARRRRSTIRSTRV